MCYPKFQISSPEWISWNFFDVPDFGAIKAPCNLKKRNFQNTFANLFMPAVQDPALSFPGNVTYGTRAPTFIRQSTAFDRTFRPRCLRVSEHAPESFFLRPFSSDPFIIVWRPHKTDRQTPCPFLWWKRWSNDSASHLEDGEPEREYTLFSGDMLRTRPRKNNYFRETKTIVVGPREIFVSSDSRMDIQSETDVKTTGVQSK